MTKEFGNILITSCGGKISLIHSVKDAASKISNKIKVIGGDMSSNVTSVYFVDEFWKMPTLADVEINEFLQKCKSLNIFVIIPSRDDELEFFSIYRSVFSKEGIHVMISSSNSVMNCIDKLKFSNIKYLPIIPSSLSIDDLNCEKFVVKERFGAGSTSIGINLDYHSALNHSCSLKEPIFQPFIPGKEISIDVYIDSKKFIKGIILRERVLIVDGESQVTKTIIDEDLEKECKKIVESLELSGHVILQAIIDKDNKINIIECNPRFGGASSLAIYAGLDSFYWFYLESLGQEIDEYPFKRLQHEVTQIRYQKDTYK